MEEHLSIHEDRIYQRPADRKHKTALYGRDESHQPHPYLGTQWALSYHSWVDGTRGWRNSAELREQVWDTAGQEGEERNAKRKYT